MAYVLGFFAADGYMIRQKQGGHYIDFYNTDLGILENIRNALSSNHVISPRPRYGNQRTLYRIQIGSRIWFRDLAKLGFVQGKSKVLHMPKIPKRYFPNFVRGYFDGDGNVWTGLINKNRPKPTHSLFVFFTCGSEGFLLQLNKKLHATAGINGGSLSYQSRAFRLSYSTQDALKLHHYMYSGNLNLHLVKKKVKFEEFIRTKSLRV